VYDFVDAALPADVRLKWLAYAKTQRVSHHLRHAGTPKSQEFLSELWSLSAPDINAKICTYFASALQVCSMLRDVALTFPLHSSTRAGLLATAAQSQSQSLASAAPSPRCRRLQLCPL
jgi:hypothetical protein